jgi:hypothetical protein
VHRERQPERHAEQRVIRRRGRRSSRHPLLDALEDAGPDADGADADGHRERPDHPPTVLRHVVAPDGAEREHQARDEPGAEDDRGDRLGCAAPRERDAEEQGEGATQQGAREQDAPHPAVQGVVLGAEPPAQLERRAQEVDDAGTDVQVAAPLVLDVPLGEVVVLRHRAGQDVRPVDHHTDDHEHEHDRDEHPDGDRCSTHLSGTCDVLLPHLSHRPDCRTSLGSSA